MPCSSINRKATFSRTVRESNKALSWKTIPILARSSNSSSSRICVTSWPSTTMRPESGRISPIASFRIRLFPEPATPNSALVSPRARRKEIPRSTSFSPKDILTSSNTMAGIASSVAVTAAESRGSVGADIKLVVSQGGHQKPRKEQIHGQDQNRSRDHGLGGGAAHALSSAARVHAVEAADGRDDKAEQHRLEQTHKHILKHQRFPGVVPVLPCVEAQQDFGDEQPPSESDQIGNDRKEKKHGHGGGHARCDQFFHGVGPQRPHGVNLLGNDHRTQLARHPGRISPGHHQAGKHWAQLPHH